MFHLLNRLVLISILGLCFQVNNNGTLCVDLENIVYCSHTTSSLKSLMDISESRALIEAAIAEL